MQKHLGSKKHLENTIQNETFLPECFFKEEQEEEQEPIKIKIKKSKILKH